MKLFFKKLKYDKRSKDAVVANAIMITICAPRTWIAFEKVGYCLIPKKFSLLDTFELS